jgi:1,2-diacylglycerol 3-alpha-glucosyltransferase
MPKRQIWQRVYRLIFPLDIFKVIHWLPKLKDYDQMIVHYYPMTFLAWLARHFYKVKYTFWYHGIMPPYLFPSLYERLYMRFWILLTRLTVSNADAAVAVSKYGQKELKRYTGLNSTVIYNKVDPKRFHPGISGRVVREKYNIGNTPMILSVGAIRPVKGVHYLIQTFHLVRKEIPQARLFIVGSHDFGYYTSQLKEMAGDGVIFTGVVSDEELQQFYGACDIYATGSQWEIHNAPVLEAQACGKPVIAFAIEPFQEQVTENDVLVEVKDVTAFARACVEKLRQVRPDLKI